MKEQSNNPNAVKKDIGEVALSQLGYLTKDVNLYNLFEGMGKSEVGKEMDKMGRYLFNHRFGGGHLWWKELSNRPVSQVLLERVFMLMTKTIQLQKLMNHLQRRC